MAAILFIAAICMSNYTLLAQNQSIADGLKLVLENNDTLSYISKLNVLQEICAKSSSPSEKLKYSNKQLALSEEQQAISAMINAYHNQGVAHRLLGNLEKSLVSLFASAELAGDHDEYNLEARAYLEIANSYTANKDFTTAISYEKRAISVIRKYGTSQELAINLLNTGYSYYTLGQLDSALLLYQEARPIFDSINLSIGTAYVIGNSGLIFAKKNEYSSAEQSFLQAIEILEPLGDELGLADYHNQLGSIYLYQEKLNKAVFHVQKALLISQAAGFKEQISDAHQKLSELYDKKGDSNSSLEHYKQHITYRDSVNNVATVQNMADLRTDFEVNLREKEINLLEERDQLNSMYLIIGVILLVLTIVLLLYFRKRFLHTRLLSLTERKEHGEKVKGLMQSFETKALESMVQGKEDERKRLALELHNHFGSLLATIKVNLNGIDDQSSSHHQTINTLVDQACTDIRSMSHKLNMGVTENFGLVPALKELTDQLHQSGEIKVEFKASVCDDHLDSKCEIVIYRIVQELVSNVLKHANATKLSVLLTCFEEEELINIIVQDNGKGIVKKRKRKDSSGIGLAALEKMVASQQGELTIDSNPESGTTISIDLPLVKAPELTEVIKKTKIVSGG